MQRDPILVTGAAGFIGFHVAQRLLSAGETIVGLDNLNDYYDPALKSARLELLSPHPNFKFVKLDLADRAGMEELFRQYRFPTVIHLAAQAGVRYSLENPHAYVDSNLSGFLNVLEGCRHNGCRHLIYASSSSVYGANTKQPFSIEDRVDHPVSLYAATKKANELMAHAYTHLYGFPTTGLRFFTVYGPWGRPDMAYFLFTKAIAEGKPIKLFNQGKMRRDFTYVDDVVDAVQQLAVETSPVSKAWRVYNIGNNQPEELLGLVSIIEQKLQIRADKILLPMQPGDVESTFADIEDSVRDFGYEPRTNIADGLSRFVDWYRGHY
ncbi:NAD-dependent epimerase [Bradyrhizobium sp. CNPSo 4010]|uniref:NAD-dependent epimerase n=1 Tax=Bradyrhizobium agreste TaxID=2751811 RepID=A0ABS0PRW0_9BRAD|nr:NAD-dependent epimerase [Bradyrhizobium agreste]MBH5399924.1 NAD-dependent epimerase [Bradyrhizobium agreste]